MRRIFIVLLLSIGLLSYGQTVDSLEIALKDAKGTERIEILHQLCIALWLNNPSAAMEYGEEALVLSEEAVDSLNIIKSFRLVGAVYYYQGDFETSLLFNEMALAMSVSIRDSLLMNNAYNNVGLLHYNMGNFQTAQEYFLRSRRMKEKLGESYGLASTVNNIGLVYQSVGDYQAAKNYFWEAHKIAVSTKNSALTIYSENNLGTAYLEEGKLSNAYQYFRNALKLARADGNINYGAVALRRIGQVKQLEKQFDSAQYYYDESLLECIKIDERRGISEVHYFLASLQSESGNYKKALEYLDKSHQIAKELKLRQQLLNNLKLYAAINSKMGKFNASDSYLKDYIKVSDSLFQDVMRKNLALIPVKIQEEEESILLAKHEVTIQEHGAYRRLFIFGMTVLVCFVLVLTYLVRKNIRANRVLHQSNDELKRTQSLLITSEKMASLGQLVAGIGHEMNNPLNFIKNGSVELSKQIESGVYTANELAPYFHAIDEGVNRASAIVKSLSHVSKSGMELNESCDLIEIINNCLVILNTTLTARVFVNKKYGSSTAIILGNEGKLHQAFLNILTNAEHAIESVGEITITTQLKLEEIVVKISDTGIGIPAEHLLKIHDPFFTTKAPGAGVGLGLFVTHSIIEEHGGKIVIDSKLKAGTVVTITLPKEKII